MYKKGSRNCDWLIRKHQRLFDKFNMTERNIRYVYETNYVEDKIDIETQNDFTFKLLWLIFEKLLVEVEALPKDTEHYHLLMREVYGAMGWHLVREEQKPANKYLRKFHYHSLRHYELVLNEVEIEVEICSGHCCYWCNQMNGSTMLIETALATQPLASDKCSNESNCNCSYIVKTKNDNNGERIYKV